MEDTMVKNLEEKTGKSLESWIRLVSAQKLEKHGQIVQWLKSEHGFTHGYANLVAHKAKQSDAGSLAGTEDLVESQYAGKEDLKPVYDKLIAGILKFGDDVEIAPKKAYVSLRRKKQFAIIQPSTKTRLDLGINMKDRSPAGRLEPSGSFNSMVSHRVRLETTDDADREVLDWLREAYDQAG